MASSTAAALRSLLLCAAFLVLLLASPSAADPFLLSGGLLVGGESISNGIHKAELGTDRNFVLSSNGVTTWSTKTDNTVINDALCHIIMQEDGNLVLYSGNGDPLWDSKTAGSPGSRLDLDDDGTLHIRNVKGKSIWTPPGQ